jgi:uncharacterized protein YeeX (DUF496 family)
MNRLTRDRIRRYLEAFDFSGLLTDPDLGWDWPESKGQLRVPTKAGFINLDVIADKRGVKVLHVPPNPDGAIAASDERKAIEKAVTPIATEHLLIFTNKTKNRQIWLWTSRLPGKPVSYRELTWEKGKSNELLLQKLASISFTISEEELLDITGVVERLRDSLDRDKVTKRFYDHFKTQKDAFRKFIKGITDGGLLDWYTSLMLNRLMFCYFLQRKGFLDRDHDYLTNRLERVRDEFGKEQFHSIYKSFLRRLFHEGLGQPKDDRTDELKKLIGDVPYLNGGIFEEHRIEREHPRLHIPDEAFEKVFAFLDDYDWHLDDRPIASGKEINPEILGYVFEKYTNQKEMGAYYTKEDITDYIAKNCIIPFLLDAAGDKLDDTSWNLLREDPNRYTYPAVGHGIFCNYPTNTKLNAPLPLPDYIERGIDTSKPDLRKRRARWNEPATADLGLPTEVWRETVARRKRCEEVQRKLRAGEVRAVNDLITLNLNVRQFAQDVVENAGPDLLLALFKAIRKLTVLDPTCGSGAFLFAALNILEPLYRASLDRMRALLGDWETRDEKHPIYRKEFAAALDRAARHPNESYFIFKSIIVHNLYGVDIMEEAVEICKLRLFLKLAAQLEPGQEIEPLPDIDFNIRTGNTLIGYASRNEVRRCMTQFGDDQMRLGVEDELQSYTRFEEAVENVDKVFQLFQQMQDDYGMNAVEFRKQKRQLLERLQTLRDQLDRFLAADYDKRNIGSEAAYKRWRNSHQPFHWFVEFYGIMNGGGFDVIIGNPPYVELSAVGEYSIRDTNLIETGNLYSICIERFAQLLHPASRLGAIVPVSSVSTPRMLPLMELLNSGFSPLYLSNFAVRPAKLFTGVDMNLTIILGERSGATSGKSLFSSAYNRWNEQARSALFANLSYGSAEFMKKNAAISKTGHHTSASLLEKISKHPTLARYRNDGKHAEKVYYHSGGRYFRKCIREQLSNEYKPLSLREGLSDPAICLLSSSLYYWFWITVSDCYHVTTRDIDAMPVPDSFQSNGEFTGIANRFLEDLWKHAERRLRKRKDGSQQQEVNFHVGMSKPIIDEIDSSLAKHYGLSEEELDFIANYDAKFRFAETTKDEE